ncbi:MAG: hypothetical protein Q4D98_14050, partial [Planctomycetia bacterium]|nr:hypothetical protein [Planctomycetia bacterium]
MRKIGSIAWVMMLLLSVVIGTGCGGGKKGGEKAGGKTLLGETQHLGSVSLAGPKGWELAPRNSKYVVMFKSNKKDGLSLYVTSEPAPGGMKTLSEKNADEVKETVKGCKTFKSVTVGGYECLQCARGSRSESYDFDNQILVTVQNGRKYEFILRAYKGDMANADLKYLNAVVASAKFGEAAEAAAEAAPAADESSDEGGFQLTGFGDEAAPAEGEAAPAE